MDKKSIVKNSYHSGFESELKKIAGLDLSDIEDTMGFYLPDQYEDQARAAIAKQVADRFALRHPILTGIPTLGIWPAVSKLKAEDAVIAALARKNPEVRENISNVVASRRAEDVENARLAIESARANQLSNAVRASVLPILAMSSSRQNKEVE